MNKRGHKSTGDWTPDGSFLGQKPPPCVRCCVWKEGLRNKTTRGRKKPGNMVDTDNSASRRRERLAKPGARTVLWPRLTLASFSCPLYLFQTHAAPVSKDLLNFHLLHESFSVKANSGQFSLRSELKSIPPTGHSATHGYVHWLHFCTHASLGLGTMWGGGCPASPTALHTTWSRRGVSHTCRPSKHLNTKPVFTAKETFSNCLGIG